MSSPLTLLTLSPTNTLPSGALILTGIMGFERHERMDWVWVGWNCVGDPLGSSDGWALFWVADDPLCHGWWMVDGGGIAWFAWFGMAMAGWCTPSHAHSLSRLSSLAMVGMPTVLSL